jgi:RNA ligase-like protein
MRLDLYDPLTLAKLDTATKYPSIETYHKFGERGRLTEAVNHEWADNETVYVTEKIDGCNARLIFLPGRNAPWIVGSRDRLVAASTDVVWNNDLGIAEALLGLHAPKPWMLPQDILRDGYVFVAYFEVYGHKSTSHWNEYSPDGLEPMIRLFDAQFFQQDWLQNFKSVEEVARSRDGGGGIYVIEDRLPSFANAMGVECVPHLWSGFATDLPKDVAGMDRFMNALGRETKAGVNGSGRSEGIVLRTAGRGTIAKARRESYDKTLGDRRS